MGGSQYLTTKQITKKTIGTYETNFTHCKTLIHNRLNANNLILSIVRQRDRFFVTLQQVQ